MNVKSVALATTLSATYLLVGCGGGGGPITSFPKPTSSTSFQITWPARSRAPLSTDLSSALSAQITFVKADSKGQDIVVKVDRDTTKVTGYTGSYKLPTAVVGNGKTLIAKFYAAASEGGEVVGSANATLSTATSVLSLTNLQVAGTIASVAVNSATMKTTDNPLQLTFAARDKNSNLVVVSAGSGIWSKTTGTSVSLTKDGIATEVGAGTSNVSVTVDGISASGTVVVSTVTTPPASGPPLATSAWPKFRHDNMDTGVGIASGAARNLKWKALFNDKIRSSAAVGPDGTIYVGSDDENLHALNTDGTTKWKYQTGGNIYSSPALANDGTVYVGCDNSYLYALTNTGTLKWRFYCGDLVDSSPAIGTDGTIYIGCHDHGMYAVNSDGTQKWRFNAGSTIQSSPAIASDGTIYFGCGDGNLYAITSAGTLKWKFLTGAVIDSSPAIAKDGTIYVGSLDSYVYAINSGGTLKWKFKGIVGFESSPAIGADGTIYIGGDDFFVYALNPTGTQKWSYQTGDYFYSSPAIGSDGSVYIGSHDGNLYAFTSGGALKFKYPTNSEILASPSIGPDGTVYVGSEDENMYAFK